MIEGTLQNLPFGDVLQVIATGQKSGVLEIARNSARALLSFDRGGLEYAHLVPGLHLGELLVRMDLVTTAEVQELLKRAKEDAAYLGLLALEAGLIDEGDLRAAVKAQVLDALAELCGWKKGNFRFSDGFQAGRYVLLETPLDTLSLLMQVARQLDDWQKGRAPPEVVFLRQGDPTQANLPEGGWDVLGYVDGRRNAGTIAAELDLPERQVYRLLYLLQEAGVIAPSPYPDDLGPVLVLAGDYSLRRLLQLSLRRTGLSPVLAADARSGLSCLSRENPRLVVVDDQAGEGWAFVREVRGLVRCRYLPVVVLTGDKRPPRAFAALKAHVLQKPFQELELQQLVTRLMGRTLV